MPAQTIAETTETVALPHGLVALLVLGEPAPRWRPPGPVDLTTEERRARAVARHRDRLARPAA